MISYSIRELLLCEMKVFTKLMTLLVLSSLIVSCGVKPASEDVIDVPVAADVLLMEQEDWLLANQLGQYDNGTQDWAAIEAAAITEGSLMVYTDSSRVAALADTWTELYPDITLMVNDSDELTVMMDAEQEAGNVFGDVWFSSGDAYVIGDMLPHQYLWNFVPDTLAGKVSAEYIEPLLIPQFGTTVLAYNSELNGTCPVSNLWELTQPEWKGKIFIEDPLTDVSTLNKLLTYVYHADELKAAYVDLYGSEPVLDADTPNAGWLWLKRFVQNAPIPQSGDAEVYSAFAAPGMKDSYMAFTSYSNYADVLDGDLAFEPCWGVQPILGVQSQSYLAIINLAPHPNAAKLFIRFVTSEEGRKPWAKFGSYFPDPAYEVPEGQKVLEDILAVTWFIKEQFAYDNMIQARDLYLLNLTTP